METLTRDNQNFFDEFIRELGNEINGKALLKLYINQVSKSGKKEEGHSKAESYVDFLINDVFPHCDVFGKYGIQLLNSKTEREHGDFYFLHVESGSKIRCNGKLGLSKKLGQPNMCSIERAVDYLHTHNLPYLIFKLRKIDNSFNFSIFDYYNVLPVVVYNDGPGQTMISEKKYYENKDFKYLKTKDAMLYLCDMADKAYHKLLQRRKVRNEKMNEIKKKYERE